LLRGMSLSANAGAARVTQNKIEASRRAAMECMVGVSETGATRFWQQRMAMPG
jgi:hypothetical protein